MIQEMAVLDGTKSERCSRQPSLEKTSGIVVQNRLISQYPLGILLLVACILLGESCEKQHTVRRGFYFWKTTYQTDQYEELRLRQAGCQQIYLRCFDVDWDEGTKRPAPRAMVRIQSGLSTAFGYTPVVFITQKTMLNISDGQVPILAARIASLLEQICTENRIVASEVQIDCDWTARSRDTYFRLLRALKTQPFIRLKKISCTVRLHQVKYRNSSGVPPVDRALVMCYNVGNLKQPGAHNSILDVALAKNYLGALESYPLPVDIALPLFSWCLHFRDGKMMGILRSITPEAVAGNTLFSRQSDNLYLCRADISWQGYSLQAGDELRVESPSITALKELADFTAGKVRNDSLCVLFFHIDHLTLSKYSPNDLETVYRIYQ